MPRAPSSARPRPRGEAGDGARRGNNILGDGAPGVEGALLLDRRQLARVLGISVRELDRLRARGVLPVPIHLGGSRAPRWTRAAVEAFLGELQRRAERGARP